MSNKIMVILMKKTVYIIGESRTNMDNAITIIYNSFYIAFEIDVETDIIVNIGCSHTVKLTEDFIASLFIHKNINSSNDLENEIKMRYHGTSQKALIVAYKDALKKYTGVKNEFYI